MAGKGKNQAPKAKDVRLVVGIDELPFGIGEYQVRRGFPLSDLGSDPEGDPFTVNFASDDRSFIRFRDGTTTSFADFHNGGGVGFGGKFGLNQPSTGLWGWDLGFRAKLIDRLDDGDRAILRSHVVLKEIGSNLVSNEVNISLIIEGRNDAPVANKDRARVDADDAVVVNVLSNDTDVDENDTLHIARVDDSFDPNFKGTVSVVRRDFGDGKVDALKYDPGLAFQHLGAGDHEIVKVRYKVTDGDVRSDWAVARFRVDGVNDAPIAVSDFVGEVRSDRRLSFDMPGALLQNDSDPDDGQTPRFGWITELNGQSFPFAGGLGPSNKVGVGKGLLWVDDKGRAIFDPLYYWDHLAEGETGIQRMSYVINDGEFSAQARFRIKVIGINDAPVAEPDDYIVDEDKVLTGSVYEDSGHLRDRDPDHGDKITVSSVFFPNNVGKELTLNSGATIRIKKNGDFRFDPTPVQSLDDGERLVEQVVYEIRDRAGLTSQTTMDFTIRGQNDAPDAQNDFAVVPENDKTKFKTKAKSLLANDTDPDANDVLTVTKAGGVSIVAGSGKPAKFTTKSGAEVKVWEDGTWTYDPNGQFRHLARGQEERDSFRYTITDGTDTDSARVFIDVMGKGKAGTATAPKVGSIAVGVFEDRTVSADFPATDPGDPLTFTLLGGVVADGTGRFTDNGDGTFTFDPLSVWDSQGDGAFTFTGQQFTATDLRGQIAGEPPADPGNISLTISGVSPGTKAKDRELFIAGVDVLEDVFILQKGAKTIHLVEFDPGTDHIDATALGIDTRPEANAARNSASLVGGQPEIVIDGVTVIFDDAGLAALKADTDLFVF